MKKPEEQFNFRDDSIALIRLLSSESEQIEYEKNVPHVDITAELLCMWFDDFWHPESQLIRENFSTEEIAIMKDFTEFYNQRVDLLPKSKGTVLTWHSNSTWKEVMTKANETLNRIAEQGGTGQSH